MHRKNCQIISLLSKKVLISSNVPQLKLPRVLIRSFLLSRIQNSERPWAKKFHAASALLVSIPLFHVLNRHKNGIHFQIADICKLLEWSKHFIAGEKPKECEVVEKEHVESC